MVSIFAVFRLFMGFYGSTLFFKSSFLEPLIVIVEQTPNFEAREISFYLKFHWSTVKLFIMIGLHEPAVIRSPVTTNRISGFSLAFFKASLIFEFCNSWLPNRIYPLSMSNDSPSSTERIVESWRLWSIEITDTRCSNRSYSHGMHPAQSWFESLKIKTKHVARISVANNIVITFFNNVILDFCKYRSFLNSTQNITVDQTPNSESNLDWSDWRKCESQFQRFAENHNSCKSE